MELAIEPVLRSFAAEHDLYLDKKESRPTREGVKCTWVDNLGNAHDLDFVLERGGSRTKIGSPAAFVETAWRRYTKHSRAKAQEIQGAILPVLTTHANVKPFAGAVVAGRWTDGALQQLRSNGLSVLHLDYDEIVPVFSAVGVDIDIEEDTPDAYLQEQVDTWLALSETDQASVGEALRGCVPDRFAAFRADLRAHHLPSGRASERSSTPRRCGGIRQRRRGNRSDPVLRHAVYGPGARAVRGHHSLHQR